MLKVVIPLTTDDKRIQGLKLRNLEHSFDAVAQYGGMLRGSVVLYAAGLSLLQNPEPKTQRKIDALKGRGVSFIVCENSLREQGVDFRQLYHVVEQDIVPSGFAEVLYLQAQQNYVIGPVD